MDRISRAPLGFFGGEGSILGRHLLREPVGIGIGSARTRTRTRTHEAWSREVAGRMPGTGAQDHQQEGDRHDQTVRPRRPGGGSRYGHHIGGLLQERAPRRGQDPGR
jgi:hypothetical protein